MDALISLLSAHAANWLELAFVLLIAEMLTGTTYLLWPAVAAGLTAAFAGLSPAFGWQAQWILFAGLTIALTVIGRPLRARFMRRDASLLNERAAALVGQRCAAASAFVNGVGSVKINDSVWRAKSAEPIEAGAGVEVLSVDGVTLTVKPT